LKSKNEDYITTLHKKYKQKTVKRKIASFKALYKYLGEEEILAGENPFKKIRVKFKEAEFLPRIIPRNEIEKLLNFMYATRVSQEMNCLIDHDLLIIKMFLEWEPEYMNCKI